MEIDRCIPDYEKVRNDQKEAMELLLNHIEQQENMTPMIDINEETTI